MNRSFYLVVAATLGSASAHAGPVVSESRSPGTFHAVELKGALGVEIRIDPKTSVEVSGDADVLKQVTTEVKAGTLVIDTRGAIEGDRKLKVTIATPTLDAIALSGAGAIRVQGIASPKLAVDVAGTGAVDVSGSTDDLTIDMGGAGTIHAKDLTAKAVAIALSGTGEAVVTANHKLTAVVSGVGNVVVYGHPKSVTKQVTGIGRVRLR